MESHKEVSVQMLREVANNVFDFIQRDLGQDMVKLPSNFYWVVPDDVLYSMGAQPKQLDCGSLNDDSEFVEKAHAHREQAIPLMFMHLAPLLYALAKAVPSFAPPKGESE